MRNIGYSFKNKTLIQRALTHSSYSEENYERLEFLGDSILDFVVGEFFYKESEEAEGRLTVLRSNYVSENHLSNVFDKLNLKKFVKLGKSWQGEISKAVKGDVVEAVIGAIYLDGGMEEAKNFVFNYFDLQNYRNIK